MEARGAVLFRIGDALQLSEGQLQIIVDHGILIAVDLLYLTPRVFEAPLNFDGIVGIARMQANAQVLKAGRQNKYCLLYTSRCV